MPAGSPTKYDPKYCNEIIAFCEGGYNLYQFAAKIGVARSTLNVWTNEHKEFLEAVDIAKTKIAAEWSKLSYLSAKNDEGNAGMIRFGLSNYANEDLKDKQTLNHTSEDGSMSPISVEFVDAEDKE